MELEFISLGKKTHLNHTIVILVKIKTIRNKLVEMFIKAIFKMINKKERE